MDNTNIYYLDKRPVTNSIGCICADDIFASTGVKVIAEGTLINPHVASLLAKHSVFSLTVNRPIGSYYNSEREIITDITVSYHAAIRSVIRGNGLSVEFKDKLFEILYYFNRLNFLSVIEYIKHMEKIDNFTYMHSLNIAWLVIRIGVSLSMTDNELKDLMLAGLFHDIGKVAVPSPILNKVGKLEPEEYSLIKRHPETGYHMIKDLISESCSLGLLQHHEKLNGAGYPHGLKGDKEISLIARILSIADVFEALIGDRPYKRRFTELEALDVLKEMAFKGDLDYKLVEKFTFSILDSLIGEPMKTIDGLEKMFVGYNKVTLELYLL